MCTNISLPDTDLPCLHTQLARDQQTAAQRLLTRRTNSLLSAMLSFWHDHAAGAARHRTIMRFCRSKRLLTQGAAAFEQWRAVAAARARERRAVVYYWNNLLVKVGGAWLQGSEGEGGCVGGWNWMCSGGGWWWWRLRAPGSMGQGCTKGTTCWSRRVSNGWRGKGGCFGELTLACVVPSCCCTVVSCCARRWCLWASLLSEAMNNNEYFCACLVGGQLLATA